MKRFLSKETALKWSKRVAIYGALGITGTTALLIYNCYRASKNLEKIDIDNLKLF